MKSPTCADVDLERSDHVGEGTDLLGEFFFGRILVLIEAYDVVLPLLFQLVDGFRSRVVSAGAVRSRLPARWRRCRRGWPATARSTRPRW